MITELGSERSKDTLVHNTLKGQGTNRVEVHFTANATYFSMSVLTLGSLVMTLAKFFLKNCDFSISFFS